MSKAFTKDDDAPEALVTRTVPFVAPGEKRYVTADGLRALRQELDRLLADKAAARAGGAPASKLTELEQRAQVLEGTIGVLTVVDANPTDSGRIRFGAWVTVEDDDGERTTWRIVGPDEVDARRGLVSVDSPLARALLGREEGDEAVVNRPKGRASYTIVEVRYGERNPE